MSEHPKPDIVAAMKWLDAFDSCVYSGPEWAAEHARTIKAEIERLRSPAPKDGEGLREALEAVLGLRASIKTWALSNRIPGWQNEDELFAIIEAALSVHQSAPAPAEDQA